MRIVITGGPSTGKTTVISHLQDYGYKVVHEMATQVITEGKILPWVDRAKFQAEVLKRQLRAEASILDFESSIFLDRGAFDGEAYYIYDGMPIPPSFSTIDASQYDMALLMEPLPFFDANDVRRENLEFTQAISVVLEECYSRRGIRVVRIPALSPRERVEMVISAVEEYKRSKVRSPEQAAALFQALSPMTVGTASVW